MDLRRRLLVLLLRTPRELGLLACCWAAIGALMVQTKFVDVAVARLESFRLPRTGQMPHTLPTGCYKKTLCTGRSLGSK